MRVYPAVTPWSRDRLAHIVETWGYPRAVSEREKREGHWYMHGDHISIAWFINPLPLGQEPPPGFDMDGVLAVHGCANPKRTQTALTPEAMVEICRIAREHGATKLYSLIPRETPNMPVLAMRRYLRRFGWLEDDFGSYMLLGGD